MKFLLRDKDFDSIRVDIPNTNRSFELLKTEKDGYTLFEHCGDNVDAITTHNRLEWDLIWKMLTIEG